MFDYRVNVLRKTEMLDRRIERRHEAALQRCWFYLLLRGVLLRLVGC